MPVPYSVVFSNSKKYPFVPIVTRDEGKGWVRVHLVDQDEWGDLLLDFSGDSMRKYEKTQDGNPRIIFHGPGGSDAVIYIRLHNGKLIITPEAGVTVEHEGENYVFRY